MRIMIPDAKPLNQALESEEFGVGSDFRAGPFYVAHPVLGDDVRQQPVFDFGNLVF